jgi:hypothetical protein
LQKIQKESKIKFPEELLVWHIGTAKHFPMHIAEHSSFRNIFLGSLDLITSKKIDPLRQEVPKDFFSEKRLYCKSAWKISLSEKFFSPFS